MLPERPQDEIPMHHSIEPSHPRTREAGFTLLEMMIVVVIILILAAIAMTTMRGAKTATRNNEAKATANAYVQAISQYHADYANRNPTAPSGSTASGGANALRVQKGPLNLLGRPYIKSIPDAVADGRTGVSFRSGPCGGKAAMPGATKQTSWVSACFGADPAYGIRVATRRDGGSSWTDSSAQVCWLGSTANRPRC
jgi:prepilin-type N-terminal cleavage/methylation domain-containing protein